MTVETNDILKIVLDYAYPGAGTALNVFHYVLGGGSADDQDVIDAVVDWAQLDWGNAWDSIASPSATLESVAIQVVDNLGIVLRDLGTFAVNVPGQAVGEVLPAANSAYLLAYTAIPQVRGSKYVPGVSEAATQDGAFTVTALGNIAILLTQYLANINVGVGINLFPGVLSRKLLGFRSFTDTGLFRTLPAYQRRRKEGVGI